MELKLLSSANFPDVPRSAGGLFVGRQSGAAENVYLQPAAGAYLVAVVADSWGISRGRLARLLGVRRETVAHWTAGKKTPGPAMLARMLYLDMLTRKGDLEVGAVQKVDWEMGRVFFRDGRYAPLPVLSYI